MVAGKPTVIYEHNDLYHFVLQATYLHSGWFEAGHAYNGPSWSVASEVLVYAIFFFLAVKLKKSYPLGCFILFLVGMATLATHLQVPVFNEAMARGMVGFSLGSLLYLGMREIEAMDRAPAAGYASLVGLIVVSLLTYAMGYLSFIGTSHLPVLLVFFPLGILAVLFGDISYAVYLCHVPIQMIVLAVARERGIALPTTSYGFFFAYMAVLVIVSTLAHYGLERPAQRWLRERSRPAPVPAVVPAE
jgi:peptidoglycan/LPS O-acetylase OafA/YrhL